MIRTALFLGVTVALSALPTSPERFHPPPVTNCCIRCQTLILIWEQKWYKYPLRYWSSCHICKFRVRKHLYLSTTTASRVCNKPLASLQPVSKLGGMDMPSEQQSGDAQDQFQYAAFAGLNSSTGSSEQSANRADDPQFDM